MLAIDPMVIASRNPEKDAQEFVEDHGVIAIEGGRHEDWSTFNFLAYFKNNSYVEWIGVKNPMVFIREARQNRSCLWI